MINFLVGLLLGSIAICLIICSAWLALIALNEAYEAYQDLKENIEQFKNDKKEMK